MKRLNLPLICDTLFTAFVFFLLFFTAIRHYTKSAGVGLAFGVAAALLFGALAFLYISGRQKKKFMLSADKTAKDGLALHLSLSPHAYVNGLLSTLYSACEEDGILQNDDNIFFVFMFLKPISEDDIAGAIKFDSQKKKVVICNKACAEAEELAESFGIKIKTVEVVYTELKENDLLPEKYLYEGTKKPKFFKRVKDRFTKKLFVPLFWSGLSLTLFSYITYFPVYYLVSGGILLTLSAAALIFGKS